MQLISLITLISIILTASIVSADDVAPCCSGGFAFGYFEIIFIVILLVVVILFIFIIYKFQVKNKES
jgi:uncharacterized membrane protein